MDWIRMNENVFFWHSVSFTSLLIIQCILAQAEQSHFHCVDSTLANWNWLSALVCLHAEISTDFIWSPLIGWHNCIWQMKIKREETAIKQNVCSMSSQWSLHFKSSVSGCRAKTKETVSLPCNMQTQCKLLYVVSCPLYIHRWVFLLCALDLWLQLHKLSTANVNALKEKSIQMTWKAFTC